MSFMISRRAMLLGGMSLAIRTPTAGAREAISTNVDLYSEELKKSVEPHPVPYIARFTAGIETLLYVASIHENRRSSRTFQLVDLGFQELKPAALVVEGFPFRWGWSPERVQNKIKSIASASDVYQGGEGLYACSLAMGSGVPFRGGEPAEDEVARRLEGMGFDRRDIFGVDILRFLPQSKRSGGYPDAGKPTLDEIVQVVRERSLGAPHDTRPNADDFRNWYAETYGRAPDSDPGLLSRAYPSPDTKVGSILLREVQIRDAHALGVINDMLSSRKTLMVVYGGGHLVTQWHALVKALGQPTVRG